MKHHNINHLAFALFACVAMTACVDDDYMETDKGHTELALTTSATEIVLNEQNHADNAVTLSWTTGTNYGTGNRITYTLEVAEAGTNYASPYAAIEDATQTYSFAWTVEDLNNMLREHFGATRQQNFSLEARVIATVVGQQETQVATTAFNATSYEPVTTTLYLIGDATPGGWDNNAATEMTRSDNGIFTWSGNLKVGSFKFILSPGTFAPCYNNGNENGTLYYSTDGTPDINFTVEEEHFYQVDVNLFTGVLELTQTEGNIPPYDQIYFIDGTAGYSFTAMIKDALDPFLFRYGHYFGATGDFKFATANGSWENNYKATQPNAPYTDTSVEFVSGFDPDNKWALQASDVNKAYKICLDIRQGQERMLMSEFTPYEMIYMIGDATSAGWTLGDAIPMTATDDPYVFTWTGQLNAGELKFSCDKKDDWNGAWFMSAENGAAPTGEVEQALFIDKSSDACKAQYLDTAISGVDNKWKLTEAGTYTITLNQLEETISIVKQ